MTSVIKAPPSVTSHDEEEAVDQCTFPPPRLCPGWVPRWRSLLLEDPLGFHSFIHVSLKGINKQKSFSLRFKAELRKILDHVRLI